MSLISGLKLDNISWFWLFWSWIHVALFPKWKWMQFDNNLTTQAVTISEHDKTFLEDSGNIQNTPIFSWNGRLIFYLPEDTLHDFAKLEGFCYWCPRPWIAMNIQINIKWLNFYDFSLRVKTPMRWYFVMAVIYVYIRYVSLKI